MKLVYGIGYIKTAKKFFKKHPGLIPKYEETLILLVENYNHPQLKLHKLKGKLKDFHSVSLDIKYRIIIYLQIVKSEIVLLDIGRHDDVYD
jgi:mRNA-degrading endonuclease YafQ of YafQ-DinJ toxin-antitoxin module